VTTPAAARFLVIQRLSLIFFDDSCVCVCVACWNIYVCEQKLQIFLIHCLFAPALYLYISVGEAGAQGFLEKDEM